MRKHPEHHLVPRLILPLINLLITSASDETQLKDKAKGILRSRICKAKEFPPSADLDQAAEILNALHAQACKAHGADIVELLGSTSIYAVKLLIQGNKKELVTATYQGSLQDFLTRKNSSLNSQFFKVFLQRYPAHAWQLRGQLVDLCSKAINGYRQAQALQLLEILVSQLSNIVRLLLISSLIVLDSLASRRMHHPYKISWLSYGSWFLRSATSHAQKNPG